MRQISGRQPREIPQAVLLQLLKREPTYVETVRTKWTEKGESFDCFGSDAEFQQLVNPKSSPQKDAI